MATDLALNLTIIRELLDPTVTVHEVRQEWRQEPRPAGHAPPKMARASALSSAAARSGVAAGKPAGEK